MEKEATKEKLIFLRLILATALAFFAGCFAYLVNNLSTGIKELLFLDTLAITLLIGLIIFISSEIQRNIDKLED